MRCKLADALDRVDQMDAIIAKLENKGALTALEEEMIHYLLAEYREILLNIEIKL